MRPARPNYVTAPRRLLAVVLGLWLSGAGCLACCERTGAASHAGAARADARELRDAERAAPEAPPAAMSAEHSCCKARVGSRARAQAKEAQDGAPPAARGETSETAAQVGPEARRETVPGRACCRRVLQSAEQARKPRVEPAHAQAATPDALPPLVVVGRAHTFITARPRAPDRGGTYLLCRALLI
jgi:hypothetical protein